ncbi:MAG TPA: CHASE domain-containing protein [Bacteriovoracaceae bacterium]|nr:CHASE domain-containing protein [Bacteriovoracaceae bacterium]
MKRGKWPWLKFKILKWILGWLGISLSVFFAYNYYHNQKQRFQNKMNLKAERAISRIDSTFKIYETIITQTQAFFITTQEINNKNFYNYYNNLKDISRFYGIKGLGFTRYVPNEKLEDFLKEIRKEIPDFEVWPLNDDEDYFPVIYLAPESFRTIGYNQGSENKRKEAIERAIKSAETIMTGKINFVLEKETTSTDPGFIFFRPLYKDETSPSKKNLIGIIFVPFLYQDFFIDGLVEYFGEDFYFKIFVGDDSSPENIIHDTLGDKKDKKNGEFEFKKHMRIFGQDFYLYFYPRSENIEFLRTSFLLLTLGLSFTFLVLKFINDTLKRAEQSSINEYYLQESLKARDEFISLASHELKTPLTSLKLRAQLAIRKLQNNHLTSEKIKDISTEIVKQVDRLERLVNDILDISRIRTGNLSLQPERFNFSQLVEDLINRMGPQFSTENDPKLIITNPEINVYWDKLRIEQVITNLLTNAIKYGENSPITVQVVEENSDVLIKVKDEGRGIDQNFRETIFNRFERAGISPNEVSGLGLGLYITYQIVTGHSGKIWVQSELGKGSTFHIKLPKNPIF